MSLLVHKASLSLIPETKQLPPRLIHAFILLNKVHAVWSYFRTFSPLLKDQNNRETLFLGSILQLYLSHDFKTKAAAHILLLVCRITACAEQHRICHRAYQNLFDAYYQTYPIIAPNHPSLPKIIAHRVQEVIASTFVLLIEIFKLSMRYLDAAEALSPNYVIFEAAAALAENKVELLEQLKKNRKLIPLILNEFPGNQALSTLIDAVSTASDGANWVAKSAEGSFILKGAKIFLYETLLTFDIPRPAFLIPQWEPTSIGDRRFPPTELMTYTDIQ